MRRWLLFVLLIFPPLLFGAMSDPAALKLAIQKWGDQAMIGTKRDTNQSNWTRLVGYKSEGCQNDFTVIGEGFNTWDAAYLDADMHPVVPAGPYKGIVTFRMQIWDNVAVSTGQFYVNSTAQPQISNPAPGPYFLASQDFDTGGLPNGLHVLCGVAWDNDKNVGRSIAFMFRVDQTSGQSGQIFYINPNVTGPPSASELTIAQK